MEIKIYGAFVLNHRVVLRAIDATPARWRRCAHDTPVDFHTGRYFACALRVRHALVFGHKWVAEILSLSGVNRPSGPLLYGASPVGTPNGSKKGCPENCKLGACALQWEIRKLSAEFSWLDLKSTHPEAAARMRAECYIARRKSKEYAPPPPGALVV